LVAVDGFRLVVFAARLVGFAAVDGFRRASSIMRK